MLKSLRLEPHHPISCFLILVLATALPFLAGCSSHPAATLEATRITELTLDHVALTFDVKVTNPWVVALPIASATGQLSSSAIASGAPLLEVSGGSPGSVPANGSLMVPLTGKLDFLNLLTHFPSLHAGDEIPYEASLKLAAGVPVTNQTIDIPEIKHDGKIPILALPRVSVTKVSWPTIALDRVAGDITLGIHNTNAFSLGPGATTGRVLFRQSSGDVELATYSSDLAEAIGAGADKSLIVRISFDPRTIAKSVSAATLLESLSKLANIKVAGTLSATTPYAPVTLNFETQ